MLGGEITIEDSNSARMTDVERKGEEDRKGKEIRNCRN